MRRSSRSPRRGRGRRPACRKAWPGRRPASRRARPPSGAPSCARTRSGSAARGGQHEREGVLGDRAVVQAAAGGDDDVVGEPRGEGGVGPGGEGLHPAQPRAGGARRRPAARAPLPQTTSASASRASSGTGSSHVVADNADVRRGRSGSSVSGRWQQQRGHARYDAIVPPTSASAGPITVMIVDDHEVVRRGIAEVVDRADGMSVVAEAGSVADGVRRATLVRPQVLLVDLQLPGRHGHRAHAAGARDRCRTPARSS